ncbi:MAG: RsmB/NOP family class I SAM-dependent RNA methyltransferase [Candidatus Omnitrophica bacterium]|nr:RsmB/NOP family class I SAM-dependent RNA methyltransferase [Candidatus Omnitrophota bacterium]
MKDTVYKLPQEFLIRLREVYPSHYSQICNTFMAKKEESFRINYLKIDLPKLKQELAKENIRYKELIWPQGGFILKSDLRTLQKTYLYLQGYIYIQNISSMIPPIVLFPQPNDKILDLCAAPGAKTTQIASLVGRECEIIAVEKIRTRYYKLLTNLKIQGANFVKPLLYDGLWIRKKFPEYFDKVLLDAPCSAEGRFYVLNPRSFKYWKYRKVKEMAHKQKRLLASAIHSLKPKGILVYSTCTFSPEENEEMVDWALNKFKDSLELLPVDVPLKNAISGLLKWRNKKFSQSLKLTCRIIPDNCMEGFFIAKFKKL